MSKETISINVATLTKQVEEGMKKAALAEHYGIPVSQMTVALKQAGLKIRKFHAPAFVLVTDDVATEEIDNPTIPPEVADAPEEVAEEAVTAATSNIWKD